MGNLTFVKFQNCQEFFNVLDWIFQSYNLTPPQGQDYCFNSIYKIRCRKLVGKKRCANAAFSVVKKIIAPKTIDENSSVKKTGKEKK